MVASHDDSVIGRVTRRQALGLGFGACASTVLARYVVSPGRVEAQAGGEALAATGQGQSLTIQFADSPTSMNPGEATLGPSQVYQLLAYDPLIHYTAAGSYEPDLAAGWGYEDNNNQVFRLSLREGVKFFDGSDLDAAAVVQWINYVKQVGTAPALAALSHTQTPDAADGSAPLLGAVAGARDHLLAAFARWPGGKPVGAQEPEGDGDCHLRSWAVHLRAKPERGW